MSFMKKEEQAYVCARYNLGRTKVGGEPSRSIYVYVPGPAGPLSVSSPVGHTLELG